MKNMNLRNRIWSFLAVLVAVVTLSSYVVLASVPAGTSYTDYEGNYSGIYKVDGYSNKTVYFNEDMSISGSPTSRYIVFTTTDQKYVSFTATNVCVDRIYVKGGDAYRIYTFNPEVSSASNLRSPTNNGGNVPDISHYGLVIHPKPCDPPPTTLPT